MEIAHFSVFRGHFFFKPHAIVLTQKSSTFKVSFLKRVECRPTIFKNMYLGH